MRHVAALLGVLVVAASPAVAQVPVSGLPSATTPLSGSEIVPLVQSGVTKQTTVAKLTPSLGVTPQQYGASGNSNGTTGNGHDDTAAFQAALNAAATAPPAAGETGGVLFVPCGAYRLTAGITGNAAFPATYSIVGQGTCSQIYLDTASAATAFTFNPTSCSSAPPCLVIKNLNFIPPTNSASTVLSTTNEPDAVFQGNTVNGYRYGWVMTASYAPVVKDNYFINMGGSAVVCTADASCNNAIVWSNKAFTSGATIGDGVFQFGGAANNISFLGNDCEANYGCVAARGVTSLDMEDNYIERNTNFAFTAASGTNSSWRVAYNWIFSNGASSTFDPGAVNGLVIEGNTFNTQTLTLATASNISYGLNTLQTGVTLARYCAAGANCTYTRGGVLQQWGIATTSSATPGVAAVTFPIACPTAVLSASATSGNGSSVVATSAGTPTTTGMNVYSAAGPATVYWTVTCQ